MQYRDYQYPPSIAKLPLPFRRRHEGFSLVELLVVCVIISLLAVLTISALNAAASYRVTTAIGQINSQLQLARQIAITSGNTMELRFYNLPNMNGGWSYSGFRIIASARPSADGSTNAGTNQSRMFHLPDGIVMVSTPDAANSNNSASTILALPAAATNVDAFGTNRVIKFYPDGSTDLPDSTVNKWTISVALASAPSLSTLIRPTGLPANYATVSIDPLLGTTAVFRP